MKVCICIPNYNSSVTLNETVASIFAQSYTNFVVKIFDNNSNEETLLELETLKNSYPELEVFYRSETVSGEENFNTCIKNFEADLSIIVHTDDVYHPDFIKQYVDCFMTNPDCAAVATQAYVINEESEIIGERVFPKEIKDNIGYKFDDLYKLILEYGNFIICPSVMIRTEIYKNYIKEFRGGMFNTSSDLDVWLRVAKISPFYFVCNKLLRYREAPTSYSYRNLRFDADNFDFLHVIEHHFYSDYSKRHTEGEQGHTAFILQKNKVLLSKAINAYLLGKEKRKIEFSKYPISGGYLKFKIKLAVLFVFYRVICFFNFPDSIKQKILMFKISKRWF